MERLRREALKASVGGGGGFGGANRWIKVDITDNENNAGAHFIANKSLR